MDGFRLGPQGEYLQGLDHLRKVILEIETSLDKVAASFAQSQKNDGNDEAMEIYLKTCNDKLLACNNELRKGSIPLSVVDSELQIIALLNSLRSVSADHELIGFVTEFWENLKDAVAELRVPCRRFQQDVLKKLRSYCVSYAQDNTNPQISVEYTHQVSGYQERLETILENALTLLRSYENGIKQNLFAATSFTDRILLRCDVKAFPILRLFPDASEKIRSLCTTARRWIDKDETYVHDINKRLREMRHRTREREKDLETQRERQKKITKTVTLSNSVLQKNMKKLRTIETELNSIEKQINEHRQEKTGKREEKTQKESMVDFLNLGIKQTKRNYSLQMKRTRLMRQVKELEERLRQIERDLATMNKDVAAKSQEKSQIQERVEQSKKTYGDIKQDYDTFLMNVDELVEDVTNLSSQITQLEIIHSIKTSPERVDSFYGQPTNAKNVKLAPSLKEKIRIRKRKMMSQSIQGASPRS